MKKTMTRLPSILALLSCTQSPVDLQKVAFERQITEKILEDAAGLQVKTFCGRWLGHYICGVTVRENPPTRHVLFIAYGCYQNGCRATDAIMDPSDADLEAFSQHQREEE